MPPIEQLFSNNQIIIRHEFIKGRIKFLTPGDFYQQLGYKKRKSGDMTQEYNHVLHQHYVNFTRESNL